MGQANNLWNKGVFFSIIFTFQLIWEKINLEYENVAYEEK